MAPVRVTRDERQAVRDLLQAADEMARCVEAGANSRPGFRASQLGTALDDYRELQKKHKEVIYEIREF